MFFVSNIVAIFGQIRSQFLPPGSQHGSKLCLETLKMRLKIQKLLILQQVEIAEIQNPNHFRHFLMTYKTEL